jgi:hypothetical protein
VTTSGSVEGLSFLGDSEIGPDGAPNTDDTDFEVPEEVWEILGSLLVGLAGGVH